MNKFGVSTEIRDILINDERIFSLIGDKIYPLVAPEGTEGDFILYVRDGYKQRDSKMGVYEQQPLVYINIISDNYKRSQELAGLVYELLQGRFSNPDMVINLEDSTEDFEDKKFIQILLFSIK